MDSGGGDGGDDNDDVRAGEEDGHRVREGVGDDGRFRGDGKCFTVNRWLPLSKYKYV